MHRCAIADDPLREARAYITYKVWSMSEYTALYDLTCDLMTCVLLGLM